MTGEPRVEVRNCKADDWPAVRRFYRRGYDGDVERKFRAFEWIQRANPHRDPNHSYLLFLEAGTLAGYWGRMPMRMYASGAPFTMAWSQETLVDPAFRRRGIATRLLEAFDCLEIPSGSLWHNEKIFAIETGAGWTHAGNFRPLKKIYKADALVAYKIGNRVLRRVATAAGSAYLRVMQRLASEPDGYGVNRERRFGREFDGLFDRLCSRFSLIADRSSATLNWRYVDIPHRSFRVLAVRRAGRLLGYAVLDREDVSGVRRMTIVDLLVDPEHPGALQALIAAVDRLCMEQEVDFAVALATYPPFHELLLQHGYYQAAPAEIDSLLVNYPDRFPAEGAGDLSNWYITYGDSDGYLW